MGLPAKSIQFLAALPAIVVLHFRFLINCVDCDLIT